LNKKFKDNKPKLIFEPGRYLVDESTVFLTTILNVKNIVGGQLANVDSSAYINLKESNFARNAIDVIQKKSKSSQKIPTWVGGNSCIGTDYLAQSIQLPKLNNGDILVFYNAGAYTIVRGEQWIHPRPAVVMIYENGDVKCIRKKENYENIVIADDF
jgi:diaminopimelate decarboxylase